MYGDKKGSQWDSWGRDQDLEIDESYKMTNAKAYDAESYDEWDNKDDDRYGAQAWGIDRDAYGASSYGKAASEGDRDYYGYAGKAQGHSHHDVGYGHDQGYGHEQGYGHNQGYGQKSYVQPYGKSYSGSYGVQEKAASKAGSAQ